MRRTVIKEHIRQFRKPAVCTPDTLLGTAVDLVSTSYEPVFVFEQVTREETKGFKGIVSIHDALFLKELPYTTQVAHAYFMPARLTQFSNFYDVAAEMVARRLNTLPVFHDNHDNKEAIIGVITARDLILGVLSTDFFDRAIPALKLEDATAIPYQSFLKDAFYAMQNRNVSEVVVLSKTGRIAGIASREDVIRARAKPTPRQRHTSRGDGKTNPKEEFYDTEVVTRDYYPLRRYYHPIVSIDRDEEPTQENLLRWIHSLAKTPHSSLVLIDSEARPRELITYQTILEALVRSRPIHDIPILVHDRRERFSAIEKDRILEVLERFYRSHNERAAMDRLAISFEESRTKSKTVRSIQVVLKAVLKSGPVYVTRSDAHDAMTAFRTSLKEMKSKLGHLHDRMQERHTDKPEL